MPLPLSISSGVNRAALRTFQISSSGYEEFSSYNDQFVKGRIETRTKMDQDGSAVRAMAMNTIISLPKAARTWMNLSPQQLQNTDNIIRLPTLLHEAVNDEYLRPIAGAPPP